MINHRVSLFRATPPKLIDACYPFNTVSRKIWKCSYYYIPQLASSHVLRFGRAQYIFRGMIFVFIIKQNFPGTTQFGGAQTYLDEAALECPSLPRSYGPVPQPCKAQKHRNFLCLLKITDCTLALTDLLMLEFTSYMLGVALMSQQ